MKITMNGQWSYITETNFTPHIVINSLQYEFIDENGLKTLKSLYQKEQNRFPSGVFWTVKRSLDRAGILYTVEDKTFYPDSPLSISNDIILRDYQEEAIGTFLQGKNEYHANYRGILQVGTGGGKTVIAQYLYAKINLPTLFLVHTKDLLNQTQMAFESNFGEDVVGVAGGGMFKVKNKAGEYKPVIIGMVQSFYAQGKNGFKVKPEYLEILKRTKFLICDECHHSSSDSWFWAIMECEAPYRLGLSATPWRRDGRALLLEAATGPVIMKISSRDLVQRGWLSKPNIKIYPVHTTLDEEEFEGEKYPNQYKAAIAFNEHRNLLIASLAGKHIAKGDSVLIIVGMIAHGMLLSALVNQMLNEMNSKGLLPIDRIPMAMPLSSKIDKDVRNSALQMFKTGKLPCLIITQLGDEGLDIPSVNCVIMATGGKSDIKTIQRLGRALRLGDRCLHMSAGQRCTLFGTRCIELEKVIKFPIDEVRRNAVVSANKVMQEALGNYTYDNLNLVKNNTYLPTQINKKMILDLWNFVRSEGLLINKTVKEVFPSLQDRTLTLHTKCEPWLNDNTAAKTVVSKKPKAITHAPLEIAQFLRHLALLHGVDEQISVHCDSKAKKKEVTYIDLYDMSAPAFEEHSSERVKVYDQEEHEPQEGYLSDVTNNMPNHPVELTKNHVITIKEMMEKYPSFFKMSSDEDSVIEYL